VRGVAMVLATAALAAAVNHRAALLSACYVRRPTDAVIPLDGRRERCQQRGRMGLPGSSMASYQGVRHTINQRPVAVVSWDYNRQDNVPMHPRVVLGRSGPRASTLRVSKCPGHFSIGERKACQ
jgi:hypothetical protein